MRRRLRPSAELRAEAWLLAVPAVTLSLDMDCRTSLGRHPQRTVTMRANRRRTITHRAALTRVAPLPAQLKWVHHPVQCRRMPKETTRGRRQLEVQLVGRVQGLHKPHGAARDYDAALHQVTGLAKPSPAPKGQAQAQQSQRQTMPLRVLITMRKPRRKKAMNNQTSRDQGQEVEILRVTAVVTLRHRQTPLTGAMPVSAGYNAGTPSLLHATVR